jgi:ACS family glucarate transporter-like MFS transporter
MRARDWSMVALLSATATASYLCRVNVSVAGALVMHEFGLSQPAMGQVFSAFVFGYALAQVPAGLLADRWGTRRILLASAWAWVAVTVSIAAIGLGGLGATPASAFAIFLALRFVLGVTESPTFPASGLGVARWVPSEAQGRASGCVLAAIGLGSALAPPLLSVVMLRWGWRAALIASAVPAAIVAFVWLTVRRDRETVSPSALADPSQSAPGATLRSRNFVLLTASYTLQGYVGYIFVFWFYLYLVQERHFDLLRGGLLAALPWLLSLVSIPLGGIISDRLVAGRLGRPWGRRLVPLTGLTGASIGTLVGASTSNAYVAALALALATACVLSVEGPFWATMIDIGGTRTGTAGGVMNVGSNVGGFVSPTLTPLIAARIGWEHALQVSAVVAIVAAAFWLGISEDRVKGPGY